MFCIIHIVLLVLFIASVASQNAKNPASKKKSVKRLPLECPLKLLW